MSIAEAFDLIALLSADIYSKIASAEIFGIGLWQFALFSLATTFAGYIAQKIIQRKAGADSGGSD